MTRILIVEDDPPQARSLARAFAQLRPDLTFVTANNGLEATRLLREGGIELVLTDLQMPGMDGFELVAWILSNYPDTSVFTMSAHGEAGTAERLTSLGAIGYFVKPVAPDAVLARLTDTLSQSVRGHVQNVSLASFLQLMEMERKTCNLSVRCDDKSGVLVVRKGELVDAHSGGRRGEDAAVAIIAWSNPSITITRGCETVSRSIEKPLGFVVMEAMRLQDEAARQAPAAGEPNGSVFPAPRRSWRPSGLSNELPAAPTSARALAIVDCATGNVLHATAKDGCPVAELAQMAALVLQHEMRTLRLCNEAEGIEELVLSTTLRCDVIRPLGAGRPEFALLVFAPEETNLVMARLELDQFVARHG